MNTSSQVKQALRALEKMQAKLDSVMHARTAPIAVIGVGCRFPGGANDPASFWELLRNGVDAIREIPPDRWDMDALFDKDPDAPGKMYTRWSGLLDSVDQFDPGFFGISPREAVSMDPQQRLLLEVAWEALERAAYTPERLAASQTGVYVGACSSDYARHQFADLSKIDVYAGTGSAHSILANRLSYLLDLQGPSMAIDTACSSSLVAVHLACRSLRDGECQVALAGGVNLILSPEPTIIFSRARMMAADGRCKTFDARADGYVRGEGCGVIVLKRLSDALADRDPIWAVIRGSAVNQDGRSNGLAAPNLIAQQRVIRQALENAGIEPGDVGYVEAHGTGTALGDPIEVEALAGIYGKAEQGSGPCLLGSVKTNIGHLEAAAGIAGLIKAVLCLQHREIPPHLHLRNLNPNIALEDTRFAIPVEHRSWPADSRSRLAAVSSFGFGGTNSHVILEAAPAVTEIQEAHAARPYHLLTLSAKSEGALRDLATRYENYLKTCDASWPDVCATANSGRTHFSHRLAVMVASAASEQLEAFRSGAVAADVAVGRAAGDRIKTAFLFTGQGSQYRGMGKQLYETEPAFRDALNRCAGIVDPLLDRPLLEVMFAPAPDEALQQTLYTQPALFALEWALAGLWMSWGVQPDYLLGHSLGELVAACVAGVFSLEDGLRLVAARGGLTLRHALPGGMAAIFAGADQVRMLLEDSSLEVSMVAENGPAETVIGGMSDRVAAAVAAFEAKGWRTRTLPGSIAFHSPLIDPVLNPFASAAAAVQYGIARIPIVSNRTGRLAGREELSNAGYWVRQLREPVRFSTALQSLLEQRVDALIEIGPQPMLLNIQRHACPDAALIGLPSLRQGNGDWQQLLQSLGRYYAAGGRVNWQKVDGSYARRRLVLPTYPFQRARYWLDRVESAPFYRLVWQVQPQRQTQNTTTAFRWTLYADRHGVAAALAERLARDGAEVTMVTAGTVGAVYDGVEGQRHTPVVSGRNAKPVILDFRCLNLPSDPPQSGRELVHVVAECAGSMLGLVRTTVEDNASEKIFLITRGAQTVNGHGAPQALQQAPLWGLGRVLAHEHPANWGGLIDLDPAASPPDSAKALAELVLASESEDQWIVRGSTYYAARLTRYTPPASAPLVLDEAGTYLISGGLGDIGLCMAEWLASRGGRRLALVGRRAPNPEQQARVDSLRQAGIDVRVFQADVANSGEIGHVIETIRSGPAPLRGVIHCAALLDDGVILRQDQSRFASVLGPKAGGAWELHAQTADCDLQFFVLCSSAAGIFGSPGQSNYAAANVFLDALAAWRRAAGLPALSVQWGPWSIGMNRSRRTAPGVGTIEPQRGLAMLEQLLSSSVAEVAALQVNWAELRRQSPEIAGLPILAEFRSETSWPAARAEMPAEPLSKNQRPVAVFEQLISTAPELRPPLIRSYLEHRIQAVLRSTEPIAANQNILDLGMDSLMVVEVLNDCRRDLQIALYPREMYSLPNFGALAQYLAREFERSHGALQSRAAENERAALTATVPMTGAGVRTVTKRSRKIIFLLSSPRSGSTLLRVMLAGHPALFSPPELHLLPFDSMGHWGRALASNYLTEGLQRAFMELTHADASESAASVQTMIDEDRPVEDVYAMLQELAGDRILVDKSPTYGASLDILQRAESLFEGARYIHLVRHPHAVMESFVRNRMDKIIGIETQDPYDLGEQAWTTTNGNILRFLQQIDSARQHRVRYEDLVSDPASVSQLLCEFLEIPFEPAMLQPYEGKRMTDGVHSRSLPIGDPGFLSHTKIDPTLAEAWRSIEFPKSISQPGRELAQTFHYTISPALQPHATAAVPQMQEHWLDVRGLRLCVCTWGPEDGQPVLCVHGILEHGASWEPVAAKLAARNFRVVALDLRGHGRSDHAGSGSYHLLDFLSDVDAVGRSIAKPFRLVGHSMGAALAAMFAGARPQQISALVLVELPGVKAPEEIRMADHLAFQLDHLARPQLHPVFKDVDAAVSRLVQATPSLPTNLAMRFAERLTEACDGGVRWRWDAMLRTRAGIAFDGGVLNPAAYTEMLAGITAPTTLVYGDGSRIGTEAARDGGGLALPAARRVLLPGGHHLHFEAPDELATLIAECAIQC